MRHFTTIIIGAGAAGMMCAAAALPGGSVLLIDHSKAPGEKIRISGGGRCNFTNMHCGPNNFLSQNPHFAKSALARYTQWDFIDLVARHGIAYHEKTLGQLFCDGSATQIIDMLRAEMNGTELWLSTTVKGIGKTEGGFTLATSKGGLTCENLVIASGGKSIPKMGATGYAYDIARQFDIPVTPTRPGLVPLTFGPDDLEWMKPLAGVALNGAVSHDTTTFAEGVLFTHRGLSGPAILQISSFWREGDEISLNLLPDGSVFEALRAARAENGRRAIGTVLATLLPARLAATMTTRLGLSGNIADHSDVALREIEQMLCAIALLPQGSEGYRTAEVTLGGIDTDALDSRTMQAKAIEGLYFIGECVDVTGWLGGFNFQWAWASGHAAGTAIAARATAG